MSQHHDPLRQANYLRQSLAQDKMPLGLFLGAGCPLAIRVLVAGSDAPLIPDIAGLTKAVCDELTASAKNKQAFENVCSQLKADGHDEPNIEDILSHIRSLRQVVGNDIVRGLTAADLDALDQDICEAIVQLSRKALPSSGTPYHKVAAWIGAIQRTQPVQIFTTNYDLLMEQALEAYRVPYFDGFVGSYRPFFDPHAMEEDSLPLRWARLWKLHGSINWGQDDKGLVSRGEQAGNGRRRVIHPSHLKYDESRRMPYLAMIDRLRAFLKQPSPVLVTCGYSFRDDHLNEVLVQGVQGNSTAIVFALLHGSLQNYPKAVTLASMQANLSLLGKDEAVIGTRRASWMENESSESSLQSNVVEWVAKDEKGGDGLTQARFKLGDFAGFGAFLEDLIGADRETRKDPNAT